MAASMRLNNPELQRKLEELENYTEDTIASIARYYDETEEFPHEPMEYFFQNDFFSLLTSNSEEDLTVFLETIRIVSSKFAALGSILLTQGFYAVVPLHQFGTNEQKAKYLPDLISGTSYGGFGLSEENDSGDPTYIHTLAVETPLGWVINGNKKYISNAPLASVLLVAARTKSLDGSDGTGIFIVETDRKGLTVTEPMEKTGITSLQVASVQLQQIEVAHDALLGNTLEGVDQVTFTMNLMKLSVAMQAVGIAQGAFAKGLEHMSVVRKFGNRLIDNQSTQEKMADMKTSIYSAEAFVRMVMTDTQNSIEVAMAKLLTANIALEVTESIIQLTGGYGFMKDSDIERYIRDAKVTSIYGGSSRSQRRMITEPWVNS